MKLDAISRKQLLALARQSIDHGLTAMRWVSMPPLELPPTLNELRGSFVTLRVHQQLRGCCGNLEASRPLHEDVWRNAWASAFADPRFAPLESDEWCDVDIHLSVLSPLESIDVQSERHLLDTLRPGIDGLVLERDNTRATFLPDVWEQLPDPADFVYHLKQKAGWPANAWSPMIKVQRYTTESFGEREAETSVRAQKKYA